MRPPQHLPPPDFRVTGGFVARLAILIVLVIAALQSISFYVESLWYGAVGFESVKEVAELGDFVELEIVTSSAEVDRARQSLASLAAELDLRNGERRSYLELLLATRGGPGQNQA